MKIGQAAAQAGVTVRAIRHYENLGLVAPKYGTNGYRIYDQECVERIGFIRCCKEHGFTLLEISTVLLASGVKFDRDGAVALIRQKRAEYLRQQEELVQRIEGLDALLQRLSVPESS